MPNTGPDKLLICQSDYLQVAVGVVKNADGRILLSLRDQSLHQGGLWEFPGGKLEPGETGLQALIRELKEEVDISVGSAAPLITVKHHYPDRAVQLNVFLVDDFSGRAKSLEGQAIAWVQPADLDQYAFPAANRPIVTAAQLPAYYAILDATPEARLLDNLQALLAKGVTLIQARLKNLPQPVLTRFLADAQPLCRERQASLLLNSETAMGLSAEVEDLHLTSRHLLSLNERPATCRWLAASCHNLRELQHAQRIGVDFAVLAPVLATQTHPGQEPLGWRQFAEWVDQVNLPVYSLGGMTLADLDTARQAGGQGIAAIRAFFLD